MNSKSFVRNPLTLALTSAMLATAAPVFAQNAEDAKVSQAETTQIDTITVTGSRISRDVYNSVSPVQVITREETTLAGFASTTSALQGTAVTGGSSQINNAYGGYVTNGGPGANTLSLRGLGPSRTLILLNGRRVAPAGSRGSVGSADLNVLPSAMIDRVEILKDGASSIYGSDAVAGVVNLITKKNIDGVNIETQHNSTEGGGGDERRYSIAFGKTGERSHFSGSYEYYNRNAMELGDRDWASECPMDLVRDMAIGDYFGSGDYIDPMTGRTKCWSIDSGGVTINTLGTATMGGTGFDGIAGRFNRWRPNSQITDGLAGYEGVGYYTRDSFDPEMLKEPLISPATTHTAFFQGGVDLGIMGDAELYYEVLANRRESSQKGYRQLTLDYAMGSPLLGSLGSVLTTRALAPTEISNGQDVAARAFIGYGLTDNEQTVDFWRATAGVRGALSAEWNYDAYVSKSRSDSDYITETFLTDRIAQSLNVVADGNGGFVCVDATNGCVAAPMVNNQTLAGNLPQAWKDFVTTRALGTTQYDEITANINVNGPLFEVPYGTAYGAFGVEYRGSEIDDSPNIHSVNNNFYSLSSSTPTRGKDNVLEAYGEIEMPLLSGVRFAEELSLNASARITDYDSYGTDTTWKIGGLWTPVSWASVRASYGTSYRAPALFEQFLGATSGFLSSNSDPCNEYGKRDPSDLRYINCSAIGLAPDFEQKSSITSIGLGGAETGLAAETSDALTIGLVLQPEFGDSFGKLAFAVDYYDIQVDNGVARLSSSSVLSQCYNSRAEEFAAGNGLCRYVTRDMSDSTVEVISGYVNTSTDVVRGWDFSARYSRNIGPGELRANASVTRYLEQSSKVFAGDPLEDVNGNMGSPKMTGTFDVSYKVGNWRARYGLEWIDNTSSYAYYDEDPATSAFKLYTPNYFLSSLSVQYTAKDWGVTAGVRNLFDKEPPTTSYTPYNRVGNALLYSGYDFFGRSFFVNINKKF